MYEQINQELEQLQYGIDRYQKVQSMLDNLYPHLKAQEDRIQDCLQELKKEESDVQKISRMSLTAVFYSILGSKEKQMEKERQEALAAQLKYDDAVKQIDDIKSQISMLEAEKTELASCESRYQETYQKKYELLRQYDSINAENIAIREQNIALCKSKIKELEEALSAGNSVMQQISRVEQSLGSAQGFGIWDTFFGGGLLIDLAKHSNIDDAREAVSDVQRLLNRFRTELYDVKITSQIEINIEGFAKFADFFFDGLIADWVVQSRISSSLESVNNVQSEVNGVMLNLRQMEDVERSTLARLEKELAVYVQNG